MSPSPQPSPLPALQRVKADLFRALAHPMRIRILELLAAGERTVLQLGEALALGQPLVSQHLAALRARDLVDVRREGTLAYYSLRSPLIGDLLRTAREFLEHRFTESGTMLRELRRQHRKR